MPAALSSQELGRASGVLLAHSKAWLPQNADNWMVWSGARWKPDAQYGAACVMPPTAAPSPAPTPSPTPPTPAPPKACPGIRLSAPGTATKLLGPAGRAVGTFSLVERQLVRLIVRRQSAKTHQTDDAVAIAVNAAAGSDDHIWHRPTYVIGATSSPLYLYYVHTTGAVGAWVIGPSLGAADGVALVKGDELTPERLPQGAKWLLWNGVKWESTGMQVMGLQCGEGHRYFHHQTGPVPAPTPWPTTAPTPQPTGTPTVTPTGVPSAAPTGVPTVPSVAPTQAPSPAPTVRPTPAPTTAPTAAPVNQLCKKVYMGMRPKTDTGRFRRLQPQAPEPAAGTAGSAEGSGSGTTAATAPTGGGGGGGSGGMPTVQPADPAFFGVYEALPDSFAKKQAFELSGRPIYMQKTGGKPSYLYYLHGRSKNFWIVGWELGHDNGEAVVVDPAFYPQRVAAEWRVWAKSGAWAMDERLGVWCLGRGHDDGSYPTPSPTVLTEAPTAAPSSGPTEAPTAVPTAVATPSPSESPTAPPSPALQKLGLFDPGVATVTTSHSLGRFAPGELAAESTLPGMSAAHRDQLQRLQLKAYRKARRKRRREAREVARKARREKREAARKAKAAAKALAAAINAKAAAAAKSWKSATTDTTAAPTVEAASTAALSTAAKTTVVVEAPAADGTFPANAAAAAAQATVMKAADKKEKEAEAAEKAELAAQPKPVLTVAEKVAVQVAERNRARAAAQAPGETGIKFQPATEAPTLPDGAGVLEPPAAASSTGCGPGKFAVRSSDGSHVRSNGALALDVGGCRACPAGRYSASGGERGQCSAECPAGRWGSVGSTSSECSGACARGRFMPRAAPPDLHDTATKAALQYSTAASKVAAAAKWSTSGGIVGPCPLECPSGKYGMVSDTGLVDDFAAVNVGGIGRSGAAAATGAETSSHSLWEHTQKKRVLVEAENVALRDARAARSVCLPCMAGRFQARAGQPSCALCRRGRWSAQAWLECRTCAAGKQAAFYLLPSTADAQAAAGTAVLEKEQEVAKAMKAEDYDKVGTPTINV